MKQRLDTAVFSLGLCESREKAKALIMSGLVFVNGQRVDKAGSSVKDTDSIELRGGEEFVSRGGKKLKKAMELYGISLEGKICADIGASTGGFTDCMLRRGAERVYAVDVGYGQLAWRLRTDPRVVNLERTNARTLSENEIDEPLDFFSADVAFISLGLVVPAVSRLAKQGAQCVCLIKPQFEAGREKVGKKGVVRDPSVHEEVIERIFGYLKRAEIGARGLTYSPIKGPEGNIEYLVFGQKGADMSEDIDIKSVVREAHLHFKNLPINHA